jgi:hypothetical protein
MRAISKRCERRWSLLVPSKEPVMASQKQVPAIADQEPAGVTHEIVLRPSINVQPTPVTIQVPSTPVSQPLFAAYAPTLAVLIALCGFYIVHKLTQQREREKQLHDLCEALKALAGGASKAAITAWLAEPAPGRGELVHEAKRQVQAVGIAATYLGHRSLKDARLLPWKERLRQKRWLGRAKIDLAKEVVMLRKAVTADPFDDPNRASDPSAVNRIQLALARLTSSIDSQFLRARR